MARTENRFLYMLKGIACLLVITIHFPLHGMIGEWVSLLSRCAVPFFFVVAGRYAYGGRTADAPGLRKKMLARLLRITCTALGVLAVYTLYSFVYHHVQGLSVAAWVQMKYQPLEWLRLAALNASNIIWDSSYVFDFLWYLFAMIWVQLFLIVTLRWRADLKNAVCVVLMSMLYLCQYMPFSATVPVLRIFSGSTLFYRNWLFTGIPFALVGVWIAQTDVRRAGRPFAWWAVAACGVMLALRESKHFDLHDLPVGLIMLTIALAVLAEYYPQHGSRALAFVGKHLSANVYYWHVLVGTVLKQLLNGRLAAWLPYLVMACTLLLSLALYGVKRWIHSRKKAACA